MSTATAELVAFLVAHDMAPEVAATLVARALMENSSPAKAPSPGALRTRRWRERSKSSPTVTKHHTASHVTLAPPQQRRHLGHPLPASWRPSADDREYGRRRLRLSDAQIDDIAEDMRLWAGANSNQAKARKADWSMTFKGFMRRFVKNNRGASNRVNDLAAIARGDFNPDTAAERPNDEPKLFALPAP
jgi:hypothetical protein